MNTRIDIEKEKRAPGFTTPENYFNELEVNIQKRIAAPQPSAGGRYRYVLAGLTAAVFLAVGLWLRPSQQPEVVRKSKVDYDQYDSENIDDFDDDVIYEAYVETSPAIASEENYDAYLIDNIDENTLLDEL